MEVGVFLFNVGIELHQEGKLVAAMGTVAERLWRCLVYPSLNHLLGRVSVYGGASYFVGKELAR